MLEYKVLKEYTIETVQFSYILFKVCRKNSNRKVVVRLSTDVSIESYVGKSPILHRVLIDYLKKETAQTRFSSYFFPLVAAMSWLVFGIYARTIWRLAKPITGNRAWNTCAGSCCRVRDILAYFQAERGFCFIWNIWPVGSFLIFWLIFLINFQSFSPNPWGIFFRGHRASWSSRYGGRGVQVWMSFEIFTQICFHCI